MDADFGRRFGRYVLLDRIATGGMAEIFLAKVGGVESFERLVAIKCLRPELAKNEVFATMFIDEANLAGQLTHANIAQIYELGRFRGTLYIALELVRGKDVRHINERSVDLNRQVPLAFAAYVVSKAAEGLDYAHRQVDKHGNPLGLVHRDVSPPNLLVGYEGEVKLVDFGIAKAAQRSTETRAGQLKGKFCYMAPEQVLEQEVDRRADVFTLGTVLYEMVTGKRLFDAPTDFDVLNKVRQAEIPDLAAQLPTAPPELISVLYRALARSPSERYQWASELAKGLEPLLIQDRAIYGAREAARFMDDLCGSEGEAEKTKLRELLGEYESLFAHAGDEREPPPDEDEGLTETIQTRFRTGKFELSEPWDGPTGSLEPARPSDSGRVGSGTRRLTPAPAERAYFEDDFDDQTSDTDAYEAADEEPSSNNTRRHRTRHRTRHHTGPAETSRSGLSPAERRERRFFVGGGLILTLLIGAGIAFLYYHQKLDLGLEDDATPPGHSDTALPAGDGSGFLTIYVRGVKAATVFLNDRRIGRAPVNGHRVPFGTHRIRVEARKKKGKLQTKKQKVKITKKHTKQAPQTLTVVF